MTVEHKFLTTGRVIIIHYDHASHWIIIKGVDHCYGRAVAYYSAFIKTESHGDINSDCFDCFNVLAVPYQWSDYINSIDVEKSVELDFRNGKWRDFLLIVTPWLTFEA